MTDLADHELIFKSVVNADEFIVGVRLDDERDLTFSIPVPYRVSVAEVLHYTQVKVVELLDAEEAARIASLTDLVADLEALIDTVIPPPS